MVLDLVLVLYSRFPWMRLHFLTFCDSEPHAALSSDAFASSRRSAAREAEAHDSQSQTVYRFGASSCTPWRPSRAGAVR
jgi:hypothetical protein